MRFLGSEIRGYVDGKFWAGYVYHHVKDFNRCPSTVHVQTLVNIWDPILCAHQGTYSDFKAGLMMVA
jgi:hypothetical protein